MDKSPKIPFFSIIIPTYNHAHLIKRCLDSLIVQSFKDWEAIVVNNYSEDNTVEVVNSYEDGRIRIINFKNNGIIASSRNVGIREAKAKWICFLDSDDWYNEARLKSIVNIGMESYDVIYHPLDIIEQGAKPKRMPTRQLSAVDPAKDLLYNLNAIPTSSTCIRRDFLEHTRGFNESRELIGVEDFDLWIRIAQFKARFLMINVILGYYHIGTSNITLTDERQIVRLTAVYSQFIKNCTDLDSKKKIESALNYLIAKLYLNTPNSKKAVNFLLKSLYYGSFRIKLRSLFHLPSVFFGRRG